MSAYQIITLKHAIKMNVDTGGRMQITSNRKGGGIKNLLQMATGYTGQPYKLTDDSKRAAMADLQAILDAAAEGDAALDAHMAACKARAIKNGLLVEVTA
jgi:hypothetical protein